MLLLVRLSGVDNVDESGLETGTSDQEAVNILLLGQIFAIAIRDTASVDDPGVLSGLLADVLGEPFTNGSMDLLRLLGGSDLASTNSPDGLIGDDDVGPILDLLGHSAQLPRHDVDGLASFALLESLAAAQDDAKTTVNGRLGLGSDEVIAFAKHRAALRVSEDGPGDVGLFQLRDRDLTSERTVGLVEDVLSGDLEV